MAVGGKIFVRRCRRRARMTMAFGVHAVVKRTGSRAIIFASLKLRIDTDRRTGVDHQLLVFTSN